MASESPRLCIAIQGCDGKSLAICDFELRFLRAEAPSFWRISGDLAPSMRKSLAMAIVRFWCAKQLNDTEGRFDVVLASDVLYGESAAAALPAALLQLLRPQGASAS